MKKKFLAIGAAMTLAFALTPMTAYAAETVNDAATLISKAEAGAI